MILLLASFLAMFDFVYSIGARIPKGLVDTTARSGYSITGSKPQTPQEMAAEYFLVSLPITPSLVISIISL